MSYEILEKFYVENRKKLVKRFLFRAGSEAGAEDVVQEAFSRALKYVNSFSGEDIDRWMSTILNNSLRAYKNEEKGYTPIDYEAEEENPTPEINYPRHVMREVYQLIQTKSLVQIEVLTLYFKQEYSAKDISNLTNYSYKMCHQIIQRFRNELKDLYGE
jgi:RNA polymerase sigma factor (sigma-70 family)